MWNRLHARELLLKIFGLVTILALISGCGAAGAAKAVESINSGSTNTSTGSSSSSGSSGGAGGGSGNTTTTGSSTNTTTTASVNNAPVFATNSSLAIAENSKTVVSITVTDQEDDDVLLTKVGGADKDLFNLLSNGSLTFISAPDYESPQDEDGDNEYLVEIEADDGENETRRTFAVTVENLLEGYVIDGPLSNSIVFLDLNGDLERDAMEPQTTTNASGYFELKEDSQSCFVGLCEVSVIATGGTDTATNENVELFVYGQALGDSNFSITPLGTVLFESDDPDDVIKKLNLEGSKAEILSQNPWEEANKRSSQGQNLLKINQQIGLLFETTHTIAKGQTGSLESPDISQAAADALADKLEQTGQSDVRLTDEVLLKGILETALETLNTPDALEQQELEAIAQEMSEVNGVIASDDNDAVGSTVLESIGNAQDDFQDSISKLITDQINVGQFIDDSSQAPDTDGDGIINSADSDDDDDGVLDTEDAFSLDPNETTDNDSDGIGDNADDDDDNDGCPDTDDAFPKDTNEWLDTDSDGIGNNADEDDDGDGYSDFQDAFPLDTSENLDTDSDGVGNNADSDDDGDGYLDTQDAFPLNALENTDTDGDGIGNFTDSDDDGDGVLDINDSAPLDAALTTPVASNEQAQDEGTNDDSDLSGSEEGIVTEVEPNGSSDLANAQLISSGQTLKGRIENGDDFDWYAFDASAPGALRLEFDVDTTEAGGWYMQVYDLHSGGNAPLLLASLWCGDLNCELNGAGLTAGLSSHGRYHILVLSAWAVGDSD